MPLSNVLLQVTRHLYRALLTYIKIEILQSLIYSNRATKCTLIEHS